MTCRHPTEEDWADLIALDRAVTRARTGERPPIVPLAEALAWAVNFEPPPLPPDAI